MILQLKWRVYLPMRCFRYWIRSCPSPATETSKLCVKSSGPNWSPYWERASCHRVRSSEKIDKYIFGRKVIHVETNHKPLEDIFKKSLYDVPARLQRILLRSQRYNLEVTYKKGPLMYMADTLSRAFLDESMASEEVTSLELADHTENHQLDYRGCYPDFNATILKLTTGKALSCAWLIPWAAHSLMSPWRQRKWRP